MLALLAQPAMAQVQMVVNFAAGGPTDIVARMMQNEMAAALGQPLVVRNVAGAGGTIGTAEVAARQARWADHPVLPGRADRDPAAFPQRIGLWAGELRGGLPWPTVRW